MAFMETPQFQPLGLIDIGKVARTIPHDLGFEDVLALATLAAAAALYVWMVRDRHDPHSYKMFERPQEHMIKHGSKATTNIAEKLAQIVSSTLQLFRQY